MTEESPAAQARNRAVPPPGASDGGGDDRYAASVVYQRERDGDSPMSEVMGTLPTYVTRGLLYLIVLFTAVALLWAGTSKVDVIVTVPAELVPEGKLQVIQPAIAGIIRDIAVRPGDRVEAGQVLLVLESETVSQSLSDLRVHESELALAREFLEDVLPDKTAALRRKIESESAQLSERIEIHDATMTKFAEQTRRQNFEIVNAEGRLALMDREVRVNQTLAEKGLVAERKLLEVTRLRQEIAVLIDSLRSEIREADMDKDIERRQLDVDIGRYETTIADLERQIVDFELEAKREFQVASIKFDQARDLANLNLRGVSSDVVQGASTGQGTTTNVSTLTAPVAGVISELSVHTRGETVSRGQTVATLVPDAVSLIAEMRIPNREIGKVREGQPIRFKFEAFPFAEYGVLNGSVENVGPSALRDELAGSPAYYPAKSMLNQDYFRVDGRKVLLLPGMSATAEIVTKRQSLLSIVFEPFTEFGKAKDAAP